MMSMEKSPAKVAAVNRSCDRIVYCRSRNRYIGPICYAITKALMILASYSDEGNEIRRLSYEGFESHILALTLLTYPPFTWSLATISPSLPRLILQEDNILPLAFSLTVSLSN